MLTFACLSVWSRYIARSRFHSVRQEKRGRGGHQRPEWSKAAGRRRAHHREVRQQPQSEDGTGPAYPALPDSCSPLHRPSAPPDSALQVLLPPAAHTPTAPYSSSAGFPLNRSAFTPSGGFRQITTAPTEAVLNFKRTALLRDKTLHVNQSWMHSSQYSQSIAWGLCKHCVSATGEPPPADWWMRCPVKSSPWWLKWLHEKALLWLLDLATNIFTSITLPLALQTRQFTKRQLRSQEVISKKKVSFQKHPCLNKLKQSARNITCWLNHYH